MRKITGLLFIDILVEIFKNLPITSVSIEDIPAFKSSQLVCIEKTEENKAEDYYKKILCLGDFRLVE